MAIGVGGYGNKVVNRLRSNKALSGSAAICLTQAELETEPTETKFRVSTRLSPADAVERIQSKLKKVCAGADLVILIANPMDFTDPVIIYLIAKYIQSLNIALVGAIVDPSEKTDRKRRNAIQKTIDTMFCSFAITVLRQAGYMEKLNSRWLESYTSFWDGRDTIQEQEAFHKWRTAMQRDDAAVSGIVQVGEFMICRLLTAITTTYMNAEKKNIIDVLSVPGYLHFATVYAAGSDRYELIKWRAAYNDMLLTSSHAARGMLLDLTVPKGMSPEEVGKICLGIYGYADENVNFYFNINYSEQETESVAANLLATGTYDRAIEDY